MQYSLYVLHQPSVVMIKDLIQNVALLISLSVVFGFFIRFRKKNKAGYRILSGGWFGIVAVAGMLMPFVYHEGIFYDGRSIIIALAGLFGGIVPAAISSLIAGAYRAWIGGQGIWAGLATILFSAATGLFFRKHYNNAPEKISLLSLWLIGIVVHIFMLGCQLLFPWPEGIKIIEKIWLPILLIFPVAFVMTATLLRSLERQVKYFHTIKNSESLYRATLYSIGDAVITTNRSGKIQQMNTIAEKLTGYKEKEVKNILCEDIFHVVHTNTRSPLPCPIEKVLKYGQILTLKKNTTLISRDGKEFNISNSAAPIKDEQGQIIGAVLVFRDISNQYLLEKAQKTSDERFRLLAENAPFGILISDYHHNIIYSSSHFVDLFGYSTHDIPTMDDWWRLAFPEGAYRKKIKYRWEKELIQSTKNQTEIHSFEAIIRCKNNTTRPIDIRMASTGELNFFIINDITEHKKAIEALKKSEEQFRSLFEYHSAVHLLIDPESGKIENANQAAEKFYGWTKQELQQMKIFDINTFSAEEIRQAMVEARIHLRDYFEFRHRLANGNIRDVEIFTSKSNIFGKDYLHSIIHDVTEKKELLREIIQAKEKAEESDRLKSAFLANMSHEIRTPLNGIIGFTDLLTEETLPPREVRKHYSAIIQQSAESLMQIINDILDISKMDAGQIIIEKTDFNLTEVLKNLETLYAKKLHDKGKHAITLSLLPMEETVLLKSDKNRLTQVFINLLDNAIKFTTSGMITFGIEKTDTDSIFLMVSDTGIGIAPEKHHMIFERFSQADENISNTYGGTGLGLSIVQKIIALMHGDISVESEPGKGACFRFRIPLNGR
ncbi:MAG: PAS domain S-box protein [Bacteroidales bacterium]|nr:PAS domain S-box protein [Bacteroidales bacterium]MDD3009807.1 PAS domain S-box protein [Bacteroidales bacterium]HPE87537.1 PAS domain S-box protein [Bacteroidales bacterium]